MHFERDAGAMPHPDIGVIQGWPDLRQTAPARTRACRHAVVPRLHRQITGVAVAIPPHSIQTGLGPSSSRHEIHRAVGAKVEPGHVERTSPEEYFSAAGVAGPGWLKMHCVDFSVSPVQNEQCAAPGLGKPAPGTELDSRRRAEADV